jgi:hypothetical protein
VGDAASRLASRTFAGADRGWMVIVGCASIVVGLLVVLSGADFWPLLLVGSTLVLLALVLDPMHAQTIAIGAFFVAPLLGVVEILRPEDNNFYLYAILMLLSVGFTAAARAMRSLDLLGLFLIWLLASATYATVLLKPAPFYLLLQMPLGALGLYLVLSYGRQAARRFFLVGLLVWSGIEATIGVLQTAFGLSGFERWGQVAFTESRNYLAYVVPGISPTVRMATGTFTHFNQLAALLCMVVPIALWRWLDRKSLTSAAYLALILSGLLCTFSRGGLLGAVVGCAVVYLALPQDRTLRHVRVWVGVLVVLVTGIALAQVAGEYVAATQNLSPRLVTWSLVLGHAVQDPVRLMFGSGLGYYALGFLPQQSGASFWVHSAPIEVVAETGIIGLVLGTVVVVRACVEGVRSRAPLAVALSGGVAAFVFSQMFDNAFFTMTGAVVVGLLTLLGTYGLRNGPHG